MLRKIFNAIPKVLQEQIKLLYYNSVSRDFRFAIINGLYRTQMEDSFSVLTGSPLYFIVEDVKRYEKYYKVSDEDIVLDAGANEGILSLIYSKKVGPKGKVYAFEPDQMNLKTLKQNLALNTNIENIELQWKGLWNKRDQILFYESGTVGASVFANVQNADRKQIEVISIDEFVRAQNISRLDFIKIDVEGAEVEVISGAVETLRSLEPNLAIATYHYVNEEQTYKKVEAKLQQLSYPFRTEFFRDGEIITYAGPVLSAMPDRPMWLESNLWKM